MSQNVIEIQNLEKIYYRGKIEIKALEGVNLKVDEGDFLALQGPSGSGKTTLLNLIGGIDYPTAGRILVGNEDLQAMKDNKLAKWRTHNIGFIFQLYNLIPVLTAYENVELPLLLLPLSKEEREKHVLTALEVVGIMDRKDHYPRQLSGGQEQRVAIARAIVTDPKIILADEPTGDLDEKSSGEIISLMCELNEKFNKTFILVTHDPDIAKRTKRILQLHKGTLVN